MEKFRNHCASLCSSSSSSSSSNQWRLNFAIVSALLASISFLTLRFSPSFLTLLLLIPSFLFLTHKKSHSNQISTSDPLKSAADHHLFDQMPHRTEAEQSSALIGEDLSSDEESSINSGLRSRGDSDDRNLFDEMPHRTEGEQSSALIGEDLSSDEGSRINSGLRSRGDSDDRNLFDEKPHRATEEESAALIGEDEESSSNGGLGSSGDFDSDLWMCLDELARNPPFSDDASSEDDDSLIEIPLLRNSSAIQTDSNRKLLVRNVEMYLADLFPESVLKQREFVELLEEINEEDNLIEIDISRGFNRVSTSCN